MSGENFYNRQNMVPAGARAETPPPLASAPPPMVNGAPGSDRLPNFATFEKSPAVVEEDRVPLNTRSLSNKTPPGHGVQPRPSEEGFERYGDPPRRGPGGMRGGRGGYGGPRDEFGNPLPPSNALGPVPGQVRRDPSDPRLKHQYSDETMDSQSSRGRGRGGYPNRGYGRSAPYGPGRGGMISHGRGMPMMPIAGAAGVGMMTGEMRNRSQGPPPEYGNGYPPNASDRPGQYDRGLPNEGPAGYGRSQSATGYGRRSPGPPSAPGYGRQPSPGPPSNPGYGRQPSPGPPSNPQGYGRQASPGPPSAPGGYARQPSPGLPSAPGVYARQRSNSNPGGYGFGERQPSPGAYQGQRIRQESPPPPMPEIPVNEHMIGQAVEMDARTGSPAQAPSFAQPMQLRDSDSDVQGLVGLQQQREHRESPMSLTSVYSNQEYVP